MKIQSARVISIRPPATASDAVREIADLAFDLWVSSPFRGRSPESALVAAERILRPPKPAALYLMPGRKTS